MQRINNKVQLINIDAGRKNCKISSEYNGETYYDIFSSVIGDARKSVDMDKYNDPIYIEVEGNEYFVGELSELESYSPTRNASDSKTSKTVEILICAAISRIAKCDTIRLNLSVPNNMYNRKTLSNVLEKYQGKKLIVKDMINNVTKTVIIEMCDIWREADCVAFDYLRDKVNEDRDMVFISVGFKSLEISFFRKNFEFIDRLSDTIFYGNQNILGYVQNKLKENGIVRDLLEIDANENDYDELKRVAYELASETIMQKLEERIPNQSEVEIIIAGGTAMKLSLDERFVIVEEPMFSVVRGLNYVGSLTM